MYVREGALQHVLQILRFWTGGPDQRLLHNVSLRSGDNGPRYKIQQRFATGEFQLESPAASEIVCVFHAPHTWPQTDVALLPLHLSERFEGQNAISAHARLYMSASEHFRWANPG